MGTSFPDTSQVGVFRTRESFFFGLELGFDSAGSHHAPAAGRFKEDKQTGREQHEPQPGGVAKSEPGACQQGESSGSTEQAAAGADIGREELLFHAAPCLAGLRS